MERFLEDFSQFIRENNINTFRISLIEGDSLPVTREFVPCNPCQDSYSCAKVFTLTAIGLLWDEGKLRLDEKITDILAPFCPKDMPPRWGEITVDMAIRHHMGLPAGYLDIDCKRVEDYGEDFLANVLSYPIDEPDRYVYTDAAYYVLARVVTQRAGMPITDYLWKKLFLPLRFREAAWSCCPMGHAMGATGLYLRSEDLVKLGAVYMNGGCYMGHRILSREWVDTVLQRGYLQSIGSAGAYGHAGMRGQMLMVLPEQNITVAWHGFSGENPKAWVASYFGG